eukprot:4747188-Pleurochrysis_carterae.AAC.5
MNNAMVTGPWKSTDAAQVYLATLKRCTGVGGRVETQHSHVHQAWTALLRELSPSRNCSRCARDDVASLRLRKGGTGGGPQRQGRNEHGSMNRLETTRVGS